MAQGLGTLVGGQGKLIVAQWRVSSGLFKWRQRRCRQIETGGFRLSFWLLRNLINFTWISMRLPRRSVHWYTRFSPRSGIWAHRAASQCIRLLRRFMLAILNLFETRSCGHIYVSIIYFWHMFDASFKCISFFLWLGQVDRQRDMRVIYSNV